MNASLLILTFHCQALLQLSELYGLQQPDLSILFTLEPNLFLKTLLFIGTQPLSPSYIVKIGNVRSVRVRERLQPSLCPSYIETQSLLTLLC